MMRKIIVKTYSLEDLLKEQDPVFVEEILRVKKVSGILAGNLGEEDFSTARKNALKACASRGGLDVNSEIAAVLISNIQSLTESTISKDSNKDLNGIYDDFKRGEISKESFLRSMRLADQNKNSTELRVRNMILGIWIEHLVNSLSIEMTNEDIIAELDLIESFGYDTSAKKQEIAEKLAASSIRSYVGSKETKPLLLRVLGQRTISDIYNLEQVFGVILTREKEKIAELTK